MKQLKTLLTGIVLAVMPTIAQAQTHIENAYKTFLKENEVAKYEFRKEQRGDKTKQDFLNIYSFTLTEKQKQQIENLRKAFDSDSKAAYQLVSANKGNKLASYRLMGPDKTEAFIGERYDNMIQLLFSDPTDSLRRYGYALEWTDKEDGTIVGRIISCLSVHPKYRKSEQIYDVFNDLSQKGAVLRGFNKNVKKVYDADKIGNYFSNKTGSNTYYEINGVHKLASELSNTEWLSQFNAMKKLVYQIPNGIQTSYYVSTIYDLCKCSEQLDVDTKKLVKAEVESMRTKVKDRFLKEVLSNAIKSMK
ncbi:hypothetical protein [Prevotella falsenii]|uniref:hypothetical protein n=1 Tax=Prevotella falsenii TaxID=515414 RepID=UPI00046ADFCC|nr:hypothetical protein [Prevotella falsenii]